MSLDFKIFRGYPHLKYGLSEKSDGAMELASAVHRSSVNRSRFFKDKFQKETHTVSALQSHSTTIKIADLNCNVLSSDGLVTAIPNLLLSITVSDCFPVYFFDPVQNVVAIAHSGWRGTAQNIVSNVISEMNSNPKNILGCIGPGIQSCHFEVKQDILESFKDYPEAISFRDGKIFISLPKVLITQLNKAGVKKIENLGECTYCHTEKYFSFRRDKPKSVEAMLAFIGILPKTQSLL